MAGIQDHLATKMVCIQIYSILRQNDMGVCKFCIQNRLVFVFKTGLSVEIMHFNQAFCSNWQQQEKIFLRLSSLCFLNSDLPVHLACVWNCLGWHNAAVNSRVEAFSSWIVPSGSTHQYLGNICCYIMPCITCTIICLHLLESLLKILFLCLDSVLEVYPSQLEGFWSFLHCWQAGQADFNASDVQRQPSSLMNSFLPLKSWIHFCQWIHEFISWIHVMNS